jgi:T5SS/PEP-CTERM-associated repeat protein
MFVGMCASISHAAVSATGEVTPSDPTAWTSFTNPIIGQTGSGGVTIDDDSDVVANRSYLGDASGSQGQASVSGAGSTWVNSSHLMVGHFGVGVLDIASGGFVSNAQGFIGDYAGSSGAVTVTGADSTWTNFNTLYVGRLGAGALTIADGGLVEAHRLTYVACYPGSNGTVSFDNGVLNTVGFLGDVTDLSGTGTINTNGMVSNVDLVFDATHGLSQTLTLNGPGQNITVNIDIDGAGPMGAGYGGDGSLSISDGLVVQSDYGYLGYKSGSTGSATVSGFGSTWTNAHWLKLGSYGGHGVLEITDGGSVSNSDCLVGYRSGDSGVVTVSGADSTWTNNGYLRVGDSGSGTLNIADGGLVEVTGDTYVTMDPGSSGAVNFDGGALTTVGLLAAVSDVSGSGVINTNALVTDVDLVFDTARGLVQTFTIGGPGRDITVNLDVNGSGPMGAGHGADGSMRISDGLVVQSTYGFLGYQSGSAGVATVSGSGSAWDNSRELFVGDFGAGELEIVNGGSVSNNFGFIGNEPGSTGSVTVSGADSTWTSSGRIFVGHKGVGTLSIADGGLVSASIDLTIDTYGAGNSFITMATGGMLALRGEAGDSLVSFLALIEGTDSIRYWEDSIWDWADITGATAGDDYTLTYLTEGDLAGYTVLTVTTAPEPATMMLLALGGTVLLRRRRRK